MRSVLRCTVYPLYFFANSPNAVSGWVQTNLVTRQSLLRENALLKIQQLQLAAKTQKLDALENEIKELKDLLGLKHSDGDNFTPAKIVGLQTDNFHQQAIINRGKNDQLYVGQPVLDAYGVVGQVVVVDKFSSRVMLVTDSTSAIPVMNKRNSLRAVAVGTGANGTLSLANISDTADIKIGDELLTSGIGLKLPAGYKVGTIGAINHVVGERFTRVIIIPAAHINSSRYVLLPRQNTSAENKTKPLTQKHKSTLHG